MRALIIGAAGQDGSYLIEQLSADGVEVWGLVRRPSAHLAIPTVIGDLLDQDSLETALAAVKPDVVYNLAAVTAPGMGWGTPQPPLLAEVTGLGVVRLLEAMVRRAPEARLVHASSSAIYDQARYGLYGVAKTFAHQAVQGHRSMGLHCSNAILFSHTSPRQDKRFLAPRIFATLARIAAGSQERLTLGDVDSRRTWGYAADYMRALPLMAAAAAGDWVVSGERSHSVRELTEAALKAAGLLWDDVVVVDPKAPRVPHETLDPLARLATTQALGWRAQTGLDQLVKLMLTEGVKRALS